MKPFSVELLAEYEVSDLLGGNTVAETCNGERFTAANLFKPEEPTSVSLCLLIETEREHFWVIAEGEEHFFYSKNEALIKAIEIVTAEP